MRLNITLCLIEQKQEDCSIYSKKAHDIYLLFKTKVNKKTLYLEIFKAASIFLIIFVDKRLTFVPRFQKRIKKSDPIQRVRRILRAFKFRA